MDIRKFFKPTNEQIVSNSGSGSTSFVSDSSSTENPNKKIKLAPHKNINPEPKPGSSSTSSSNYVLMNTIIPEKITNELDIANFLDDKSKAMLMQEEKIKILMEPFKPSKEYNFRNDVASGKRPFLYHWFEQYDWVTYSPLKQGVFCRHCVMFKPIITHGSFQGAFILTPFQKYKDFHEAAKKHMLTQWHKNAIEKSKHFIDICHNKRKDIVLQLDEKTNRDISENRNKLLPILKSIIFCGIHDIPLRGKGSNQGNFQHLLDFRVDAGDMILKDHLEGCGKKAKYTSHRIQNELVNTCGFVIKADVVHEINNSECFSVLADETADIAGIEQLSIGARYFCGSVKEAFLGFVQLKKCDAQSIAHAILQYLEDIGLDMSKLVGQGYDGCATMSGHIRGVQQIINDKYPKALFFHCSSHKLNLVINDLNKVSDIRNAIGTIKDIINFFRESPLRRQLVPNIGLLCETRWSAKYKSIRKFNEHFLDLYNALQNLSTGNNTNSATKSRSYQLLAAVSSERFIVCLKIISKYSFLLEPTVNIIQGISVNIFDVRKHIQDLTDIFKNHRLTHSEIFREIFLDVKTTCDSLGLDIKMPRICNKQIHRSNIEAETPEIYFRRNIFCPYLDSLIESIEDRFSQKNSNAYMLFKLHPKYISTLTSDNLVEIETLYGLKNIKEEGLLWKDYIIKKNIDKNISFEGLLELCTFFPLVKKCLLIALAFPATTASVERSFSTLRRIKTWLRSTISEDRLDGLAMMSVYRERISSDIADFCSKVIDKFGRSKRNLQFLFDE